MLPQLMLLFVGLLVQAADNNHTNSDPVDSNRTRKDFSYRHEIDALSQKQIYDQELTDMYRFPFLVSINKRSNVSTYAKGNLICSGIMLDKEFVLTSGSCVSDRNADELEIHFGSEWNDFVAVARNVSTIIFPSRFNDSRTDQSYGYNNTNNTTNEFDRKTTIRPEVLDQNDTKARNRSDCSLFNVAILKLIKPVEEGNRVSGALPLMDSGKSATNVELDNFVKMETVCQAAGFGMAMTDRYNLGRLVRYKMRLANKTACQLTEKNISDDASICVINDGYRDNSCFNEDGVPLVCNGKIYGIYVFQGSNKECPKKYDIFCRIDLLEDFIKSTMKERMTPQASTTNATRKSSTSILPLMNMKRASICNFLRRPPSGSFKTYCTNMTFQCCPSECYTGADMARMSKLNGTIQDGDLKTEKAVKNFGDTPSGVLSLMFRPDTSFILYFLCFHGFFVFNFCL